MNELLAVRRAAVLGAGVMGAQIAAHLVNAGIDTLLFELPGEGADPSAPARKAIAGLRKLEPSPLAEPAVAERLCAANYDTDLARLADCDLVIEAIAERLELKEALYRRIAPHLDEGAVLASNTSGLSIEALADSLPEPLRPRFCGVHFFNPPRYMHLVELIPADATDAALLDRLEAFLVSGLGKGVIRAKDTPNFIANRIGVFSLLAAMHHAEVLGISPDVVDKLTGPAIGRAKSATWRTADVVGLDTLAHVVDGSAARLTGDPWHAYLRLPEWLHQRIQAGALGQKTRAGVYRKDKRAGILVWDPRAGDYRPAEGQVDEQVQALLAIRDPAERLGELRRHEHPQAQFLWAIHRDLFHYAAVLLADIAETARDVDLAMRWGFGWHQGPFEIWQAAGWAAVREALQAEIAAGETLSFAPLPDWVERLDAVHGPQGSYSPALAKPVPQRELPVYRRQRVRPGVLGEFRPPAGETAWESEAVRLWSLDGEIGILSFKTAMHTVSDGVLKGTLEAVAIAEQRFPALVIWQDSEPFSVGANLKEVASELEQGHFEALEQVVERFQQATGALRRARIPVVAGLRGMALGGGCEYLMHCDRVVAALESYVGLVEVGVGLIPAGGGCKEMALRAARQAPDGDVQPYIQKAFEFLARGQVAKSAVQAQRAGLLRESDLVVMNPDEVLHVALWQARALAEAGYRPPAEDPVPVAGRDVLASLRTALVNMHAGGFISDYDYRVGSAVAEALCGGELDAGTPVSQQYLLDLERRLFVALLREEKTQQRIVHMLKTGKPLRN
ncbi:3-hydroxyacyl-CoA dehydrogenase/enoyl-CoA hydratase family protein [Alkalilimnicola sp. S0819]|uniref:3-hydroxyacyl-CoA dehydrogenase/enoyl-CoA hydratase family protein n=1 Tax=Alkalilimnicola sp. S0819 TaxID=2613922 RepID=UPI0012622C59|nr:3-hydroxyacyl-CoA dehydrogenase/enoyl-CoA hydratase family protein [Alkalilimnicola sp. S0819]KAB7627498.1 3-hydroxyacyl-CoA dehydrogenase/enoyl-CoA hydratase family protein [Alkalilimnicola sp. S0819]MPQ15651.1 3-hydroxyacyl-CoA dehydrogenase [Alkalilimnicola sp. S0819]